MSFEQYLYVIMGCGFVAIIWWAFDEIRIQARRMFGKKNR
jgi:uncharacterized membrane protein YwzB